MKTTVLLYFTIVLSFKQIIKGIIKYVISYVQHLKLFQGIYHIHIYREISDTHTHTHIYIVVCSFLLSGYIPLNSILCS